MSANLVHTSSIKAAAAELNINVDDLMKVILSKEQDLIEKTKAELELQRKSRTLPYTYVEPVHIYSLEAAFDRLSIEINIPFNDLVGVIQEEERALQEYKKARRRKEIEELKKRWPNGPPLINDYGAWLREMGPLPPLRRRVTESKGKETKTDSDAGPTHE